MLYAKIKDGKIIRGPKVLPKTEGNISGFNLLPDAELKEHGWLPVEGFNYSRSKQVRGEPVIQEDKVVYPLTDRPEADVLAEIKEARIAGVKARAGNNITKQFPLFKQINAALGVYDELKKNEIVALITAERDECDTREAAINACTTIEELDNLDFDV